MANYAPALGLDKNGIPIQNAPPPVSVIASYHSENAVVSSMIGLTHNTTLVEVVGVGGAVAIRWVRTGDGTGAATSVITTPGTTNFNHVVPADTVRQFVVPRENGGSSEASVQGVNRGEGLYQRIAFKSAGVVSSVLLTEYGF